MFHYISHIRLTRSPSEKEAFKQRPVILENFAQGLNNYNANFMTEQITVCSSMPTQCGCLHLQKVGEGPRSSGSSSSGRVESILKTFRLSSEGFLRSSFRTGEAFRMMGERVAFKMARTSPAAPAEAFCLTSKKFPPRSLSLRVLKSIQRIAFVLVNI